MSSLYSTTIILTLYRFNFKLQRNTILNLNIEWLKMDEI